MVFFDRSWYSRVLVERVEKVAGKREVTQAFHEINEFERTLADDGQVLVKLFLHISRKEQVRRFKKWEKDPTQRWKVKPEIWRYARRYDDYLEAMEDMLEETSTTHAPWTIVEANDPRWATFEALTAVIVAMEAHLAKRGKLPRRESAAQARARRARDTTE
jgi:polyphosphate kinase 2 (PPK2 family)